ncbi:MAG: VOC family protein [Deltaproteobacteria bacterium]|nr:VOC family protein [Deltaproteobacteria bacterium]
MTNAAIWFEIYVQDMERAKGFYEAVLARKLERLANPELEMWAFPMDYKALGAGGALVKMAGVPSGGNSTLVYFHSTDCAIEEARVEAAGGRVFRPKMSIGQYGSITLAIDTEGNMFGIHSMS